MTKTIVAVVGFIGAAVAIPLTGFGILPVLKRRAPAWSDAGGLSDLAADEPQERRFLETVKQGWEETKRERTVWLVKKQDGTVRAYSPSCPHLGCGYRWFPSEQKFKCPCHASVFDINGKVLAGPAPRPLDTLDVRVDGEKVYVKFEIFQVGTATKTVA
ncbi:MAG: ubiquinol-cytochrome c reductase iron-sulfur subunit [Nitrospiraceae bacterium]|nr:ubiquinol-cytochrome c reductase iron-sulfur subunit [Nitrospiraceae bacterium]